MEVQNVSFGAQPIAKTSIKKLNNKTKQFENLPVYFVKLEAGNRFDMNAVNAAARKWKDAIYIKKIATAAQWIGVKDCADIEVYALTKQKDRFNRLTYRDLLGFAEMRTDYGFKGYNNLYRLQVNPEVININQPKQVKYQHAGSSMLKSLKKIYNKISLYSVDDPKIEQFYINHGFIRDYKHDGHFLWSSNLFERIKLMIDEFFYPWKV